MNSLTMMEVRLLRCSVSIRDELVLDYLVEYPTNCMSAFRYERTTELQHGPMSMGLNNNKAPQILKWSHLTANKKWVKTRNKKVFLINVLDYLFLVSSFDFFWVHCHCIVISKFLFCPVVLSCRSPFVGCMCNCLLSKPSPSDVVLSFFWCVACNVSVTCVAHCTARFSSDHRLVSFYVAESPLPPFSCWLYGPSGSTGIWSLLKIDWSDLVFTQLFSY